MAQQQRFNREDFQRITDEASSVESGRRFGGAVRRFARASCEIGIIFGDADSQRVWFAGIPLDEARDNHG